MQLKWEKDLCSVWRRCYDWLNVSQVVCEVHAGDFSLDDAPWSSRPDEVHSEQIETLRTINIILRRI